MAEGRPILITGAHRSGTTWCGRVLASQPDVFYVDEPFHLNHPPGIFPVRVGRWFEHVPKNYMGRYEEAMQQTVHLKFALLSQLRAALRGERQKAKNGWRGAIEAFQEWGRWTRARWQEKRPLLKDPIALFSAEWIAERFDAQVIVMVRHPAGFVHSLRRAGWTHDFSSFTEQPALLEGVLAPFAEEIRRAESDPGDIVEQAILLWKIMYHVVDRYRERHPDWTFVRNEDLGAHPMKHYRMLCQHLNLSFDSRMKQTVHEFTGAEDQDTDETPLHAVRRDSEAEVWKWKNELNYETIHRVKKGTSPVWENFYTNKEW
ncbi:hypothetical protein GGQ03_003154 [Salinibacter ruber]|uniref:sulfotransferase n=1 Tax=Salinibacter ruber TaxID=146919 RepID=UPI0021677F05|nr:sulfotransferase [Salinibacter ruber]MCS4155849.1 hypothetical protein [Salinibacter ruber]